MPIPEEFVKKRTEVTISRASLEAMSCKSCGAKIESKDIQGGYAKCGYCGSAFALSVDGKTVA
jgi:ribosomal protein L37AE/L43A